MAINIRIKEETAMGILSKITYLLAGILVTAIIFALLIKQFQETGIWLALITSIIVVALGFYYSKKGTAIRSIIWGIFFTIIACSTLYIIALKSIEKAFEGF